MEELNRTLEEVVRRERARVVGGLVRALGNLDAAEEAFQDAVVAALATWPANGLPANPAAWLTSTARNRAVDAARHRRVVDAKSPLLAGDATVALDHAAIGDDELRLIFTCCHPALTLESQVALTLKIVAGFSVEEIARGFVSTDKTIAQRITRAKATLAPLGYEVPDHAELPQRLAAVLAVVYLIFNEGHAAVRADLQRAALRLAGVLCNAMPREPEVFGLFAMIAFSSARTESRTDDNANVLLLSQQDRSRWDRAAIKEGLMALSRARRLGGRGSYVLQAELAACHVTAPSYDATPWRAILALYDELAAIDGSPIVALNRAVAVGMAIGPAEALAILDTLEEPLARYPLFRSVREEFLRRV